MKVRKSKYTHVTNSIPPGTARYCPPEYFEKGEYYGKQATVWSLGVLLFLMGLYPDSCDIGLMDADIWYPAGLLRWLEQKKVLLWIMHGSLPFLQLREQV